MTSSSFVRSCNKQRERDNYPCVIVSLSKFRGSPVFAYQLLPAQHFVTAHSSRDKLLNIILCNEMNTQLLPVPFPYASVHE